MIAKIPQNKKENSEFEEKLSVGIFFETVLKNCFNGIFP